MSEDKRALVLHTDGGGDPILVAIGDDTVDELTERLPELLRLGTVDAVIAANGTRIVVNFGHVAVAHVEVVPSLGNVYGSVKRTDTGYRH